MRKVWLTLALVVATGGILAGALGPALEAGDRLWPVVWLPWAAVGYLILLKRPGNGVGAACLTIGAVWGVSFGLLTLSAAFPDWQLSAWAEMINAVLGVFPFLAIVWLLLVFPSGNFESRWERITAIGLLIMGVAITFGFAVNPMPMEETGQVSPLAVPALGTLAAVLTSEDAFWAFVLFAVAALILMMLRWRRSREVERLQYRWLAVGTSLFVLTIMVFQFAPEDSAIDFLWFVGASAIPLSIGIAIFRYRLYDIDRLVSRTVSYLIVVGVLAAAFVGVVTLAGSLLETDSDLVVAASTLAAAALFNPLRKRVQRGVDHRFNRSRYDAQIIMDRFAGSLRDRVDSEEVVDGWVGVVAETMQPAAAGVWVRGSR